MADGLLRATAPCASTMGILGPYSASSGEDNHGQPPSSPPAHPIMDPEGDIVIADGSNNANTIPMMPTMSNNSSGRGSSRSTKRGSQDNQHYPQPGSTSPSGSSCKRPRIDLGSDDGVRSFTREQRMTLGAAADILGIPLERLLAAVELAVSVHASSEPRNTPASSAGGSPCRRPQQSIRPGAAAPTVGMNLLAPPAPGQRIHRSGPEAISHNNVFPWLANVANETRQQHLDHSQDSTIPAPAILPGGLVLSGDAHPEPVDGSSGTDFLGYTPGTTTASGSPASLAVPPQHPLPKPRTASPSVASPASRTAVVTPLAAPGLPAVNLTGTSNAYLPLASGGADDGSTGYLAPPDERDELEDAETPVKGEHNDSSDGGKSRTGNARGKRSGPFTDIKLRHETGVTRKVGACIRCSMQRIRCNFNSDDPNGCCMTCIQATRTRMYWLPCLRYRVSEAELLDHVGAPRSSWTLRWKKMVMTDIKGWVSRTIKVIEVTQDVGGHSYEFRVRRFAPVAGDALARRWRVGQVDGRGGVEQRFECAPYGIASMREAGATLSEVVKDTVESAVCHYVDETDALLRKTYLMAHRYSMFAGREEEKDLLTKALQLWNGCRMESRSERICGDETLGMAPHTCNDRKCPNQGLVLLPPVFSAQLEVIMTVTILVPLRNEVLKRLKELIQENQRKSWFAIYLCMFILLHSCSMLTAGDNAKARKQGHEGRFFRHSIVQGLHNGAKILLAYFHYCNKGGHPFQIDWTSPDQAARSEFNKEQVQFMAETVQELAKRVDMFRKIRQEGHYEHDYYFLSQLYDFDWKPTSTI